MTSSPTTHNRKLHGALLIAMLLLFLVVYNRRLLFHYTELPDPASLHTPGMKRAAQPWNKTRADSVLHIVRNGDLVLRSGSDGISNLFKRVNTRDKSYSHAGIVFIENGCPMVYNCIGTAEDPHALLRRDSLGAYISPLDNLGCAVYRYNLKPAQLEKLHETAVRYFKERRGFDPYFDLSTDSALYCTEFVYKALAEATGHKTYLSVTHAGAFGFVAVDDLFARKDIRLVCKIAYMQ